MTLWLTSSCAERHQTAATPEAMAVMIERAASELPETVLVFDEQTRPIPPWQAYPELERLSMGWRMGSGQDYWIAFSDWYERISIAQRSEYRTSYPEPADWSGFYELKHERLNLEEIG